MKNKKYIMIGFIILLVVLVNVFVFKVVLDKKIDLIKVPVANKDIKPRTKISKNDLTYIDIPKAYVNDSAYIDDKDIIGKYNDISCQVPKGSLFYKTIIADEQTLTDQPTLLLKDNQAILSISSDITKSSGASLLVNQLVDVYVTTSNKPYVADVLLKSVRIVGIKDRNGLNLDHKDSSKIPFVILLAVNQDYMGYLKKAEKLGTIEIVSTSDKLEEESVLNTSSSLLGILQ
ncbi:MAG: SAF domain-containing protein [Erysipelotrichaceae bacterium]